MPLQKQKYAHTSNPNLEQLLNQRWVNNQKANFVPFDYLPIPQTNTTMEQ